MSTQKIEFDGIAFDVPLSECIKVHSYGVDEFHPIHAVTVFHFPSLNQISIHKYSQLVYEYAAESIRGNEYHVKTIFIL